MSTVFASQVDGWDDDGFDGGWNDDPEFRYVTISHMRSANCDGNLEGYDGNPIHYVDIEETPEMYFEQKKYENYEQKNFNENIDTVKECMEMGIMLPSPFVVGKIVEKLRSIAANG